MRTQTIDRPVEASGIAEQGQFQIAMNRKMFEMWSDGLYSNKPKAVLRELSANAWDAHLAAGKEDVPFEVHLPTVLSPTLTVKDFGTGLPHDSVMKLYTTYGSSAKDGQNTQFVEGLTEDADKATGGFGLGSKSPFAVSSEFTVISRYKGEMRVYACFVGDNGIPQIVLLDPGAIPTDEPDGLEVSVPVPENLIARFKQEAPGVFEFYPTQPIVKGLDRELPEHPVYVRSSERWGIRNRTTGPSYGRVVMGVVSYPVDAYQLSSEISDEAYQFLVENRIDFFLGMGDVDLTPSRESLSYNSRTIQSLSSLIEAARREIRKEADDAITAPGLTLWQRSEIFLQMRDALGDTVFDNRRFYPNETDAIAKSSFYADPYGLTHRMATPRMFRDYLHPRMSKPDVVAAGEEDHIFVIDDLPERSRQVARIWHNYQTSGKNVHLFTAQNLEAEEIEARVRAHYGNPPSDMIVRVSDLDAPPRAERKSSTSKGKLPAAQLRRVTAPGNFSYSQRGVTASSELLEENETLPEEAAYILTERGIAQEGTQRELEQIRRHLSLEIFFIPVSQKSKIPNDWLDFEAALKAAIKACRASIDVKGQGRAQGLRNALPPRFIAWVCGNEDAAEAYAKSRRRGSLRKLVKAYVETRHTPEPAYHDLILSGLGEAYHEVVNSSRDETEELLKMIAAEEPILASVVLGERWVEKEACEKAAWDALT